MSLSFTSWSCIAMAAVIFVLNVYMLTYLVYDLDEIYAIRNSSWDTWEEVLGNLQRERYLMLIYMAVLALFSLLTIVGVVKRKVYLILPLCLVIPIGCIYRADWYYLKPNWPLRYAAVFSVLFLLYCPLIAVWREIRQEKIAKRRKQERI